MPTLLLLLILVDLAPQATAHPAQTGRRMVAPIPAGSIVVRKGKKPSRASRPAAVGL